MASVTLASRVTTTTTRLPAVGVDPNCTLWDRGLVPLFSSGSVVLGAFWTSAAAAGTFWKLVFCWTSVTGNGVPPASVVSQVGAPNPFDRPLKLTECTVACRVKMIVSGDDGQTGL